MHKKEFISAGKNLDEASHVLILLHGRGADADDILGLAGYLNTGNFALLAPQATNRTWYPYSFLAPPQENEPWLSSAIGLVNDIVHDLMARKFSSDKIYFLGFSQGACLMLEYVTRNAMRYGGIIAFTGGLIGDKIYPDNYTGDFGGTPVFMGSSDPDPHVPVERVNASALILEQMNAVVTKKIYENMGHTINQDEINYVDEMFFSK